MKMPTGRSLLKPKVSDNLIGHRYAELIDRPQWDYMGAPRMSEHYTKRHARAFSLKRMSSLMTQAVTWTMDLQGEAILSGFFLHRSGWQERVNIIAQHNSFETTDGYAAISWLEHNLFINQSNPDRARIFTQALRFIKQQDQFGYSGAWDRRVQFHSIRLVWFRVWCSMRKPIGHRTARDKQVLAAHEARVASSRAAQPWAYGVYLAKHWIDPKDGKPRPHEKKLKKPRVLRNKPGRTRLGQRTQMDMKWPGQTADATAQPPKKKISRPRSKVSLKALFRKRPTLIEGD